MTRRTLVLASAAAALSIAATAPSLAARWAPASSRAIGANEGAPRVRVQVLNTTTVRGLGRRAMLYLRDQGFDVVEVGTVRGAGDTATTIILDRSGHPEWAKRVATAIGHARVESRPDSSRYLDVTVLLGSSWRPPAEPFYP